MFTGKNGGSNPGPIIGNVRDVNAFEELMLELKTRYTIAIVTHNLQQAQRVADMTGFLYVDTTQGGRTGYLVEFGESGQIFQDPREKHTRDYIRGEFS